MGPVAEKILLDIIKRLVSVDDIKGEEAKLIEFLVSLNKSNDPIVAYAIDLLKQVLGL